MCFRGVLLVGTGTENHQMCMEESESRASAFMLGRETMRHPSDITNLGIEPRSYIFSANFSTDSATLLLIMRVIWRMFHLWLRFITFRCRSTHLAYHVHKSGRKTSFIIIIINIMRGKLLFNVFKIFKWYSNIVI